MKAKDEDFESSARVQGWENRARNLNQILEGNPIPTFVIDILHRVTHWNRACERLTGIAAAEIVGTERHRKIFYAEPRALMADLIVSNESANGFFQVYGAKCKPSQLVRGGYEGEDFFPGLGKSGKWLFFTAAPIKDREGRTLGAIETLQDITDQREAEQGLRASEARYRQLFETANDAILVLKEGLVVDCNQKALDLFAFPRQAMRGLAPFHLSAQIQPCRRHHPDGPLFDIFNNLPKLFEWRFLRRDGTDFDAEVSLTLFSIAESPHALAIIRDVSEPKRLIAALRNREKELDEKRRHLEKVNQALKASLDHREIEKRAVEESLAADLKRFVLPYLEALGRCGIDAEAEAYLKIIENNLKDLSGSGEGFFRYLDLTPTEVRIADLIRSGRNSKEVAGLLGISSASVQWHRKHIRAKLGLRSRKTNLYTYLNAAERRK